MGRLAKLLRKADRIQRRWKERFRSLADYSRYRDDPAGYCRDVLNRQLTPQQEEICRLIRTPPYRVLAPAGHNVGKSFLAGCLVNWWYDCFDPGIVLTTAPTDRQVRRILWKEVRLQRGKRGGFPGPKAPLLWSAEDHFAEGFTAREATRFQGHHGAAVFILFDEAEGVGEEFWESAETMIGGDNYGFLGTYNPTTQSAPTVEAERSGRYHISRLSALDHPNILAEAKGERPPYPSAIRLGRLLEQLEQWCQEVPLDERQDGDVVLCGRCFRPGMVAQARLLGVRPSRGFDSVWSEAAFDLACTRELPLTGPLQVGCDVARYGDDFTCLHVRKGGVSLHHESHNGLSTVETTRKAQAVVYTWGMKFGLNPKSVPVAVDDVGVGGGVTDLGRSEGWNFIGVNTALPSTAMDDVPNLRSALWLGLANEAAKGNVSFRELTDTVRAELRRQFLAVRYSLDGRGRRCVEEKKVTKARIKRSPDDADGVLLAYANIRSIEDRVSGRVRVAS